MATQNYLLNDENESWKILPLPGGPKEIEMLCVAGQTESIKIDEVSITDYTAQSRTLNTDLSSPVCPKIFGLESQLPKTLSQTTAENVRGVPYWLQEKLIKSPVEGDEEIWDAVPDLDNFLTQLYTYWFEGGFSTILAKNSTQILSLAFTICFSWLLISRINIVELITCRDEACKDVTFFVTSSVDSANSMCFKLLTTFYLPVFTFALMWNVGLAYHNCLDAWTAKLYYRKRLHILNDDALNALQWPEVVALMIDAQQKNPFCIVELNLTALDISNILMRIDNYLIAIVNKNILTSGLPVFMDPRFLFTNSPLWNVRFCVFYWMFDNRSLIRTDFITRPNKLKWRFRILAIINFLLMGPILVFVFIFFFLKHANDFRSGSSTLLQRDFNPYASLTFRGINELPHQLEKRLQIAKVHAEKLASYDWKNPVLETLLRCAEYMTSSVLALMLLVGIIDDAPLKYVQIWGRNLLWYAVALGSLLAILRSSDNRFTAAKNDIHADDNSSSPLSLYILIMKVLQFTHSICGDWRCFGPYVSIGAMRSLKNQFFRHYFRQRYSILLDEVTGVLLTPYLLFFCLPRVASDISRFVNENTYTMPFGDICCFGTLDRQLFGCPFYDVSPQLSAEKSKNYNGEERYQTTNEIKPYRMSKGKLEKSIMTFILHYRISPSFHIRTSKSKPIKTCADTFHHLFPLSAIKQNAKPPHCQNYMPTNQRQRKRRRDYKQTNSSSDDEDAAMGIPKLDDDSFDVCREITPRGNKLTSSKVPISGIWGWPEGSEVILKSLEKFQKTQLETYPVLNYSLPKSLTAPLGRYRDSSGRLSETPYLSGIPDIHSDSSYFFWIERLYEYRSGFSILPSHEVLQYRNGSLKRIGIS